MLLWGLGWFKIWGASEALMILNCVFWKFNESFATENSICDAYISRCLNLGDTEKMAILLAGKILVVR